VLNFVLQFANIIRNGIHAECVQASVEHVGLDANLIKRFAESAHSSIRVFSGKKVYLLEGSSVGLNAVENAHVDDCWSNAFQLVFAGLELS